MSAAFILLQQSLPLPLAHWPLEQGTALVGRSSQCDFVVNDPSVSRRHAEIRVDDAGLTVVDLASSNGTYVNDDRIATCLVRRGQRLRFGDVSFLLTSPTVDCQDVDSAAETDHHGGAKRPAGSPALASALSPSQRRVLALILEGLAEKQIAGRLDLSSHTVHNHVKAIYRIIGVHSRPELLISLLQNQGSTGALSS
jgi:DNA-binding CsgD family transcriptional regulator